MGWHPVGWDPAQWKGESEMNSSIHFSLLLDCGTNGQPLHAPASIPSPTMDCVLKQNQNKPFLKFSVSYFVFISHEVTSTHTKSSVLPQSAQAHHQWWLPLEALRYWVQAARWWPLLGADGDKFFCPLSPKPPQPIKLCVTLCIPLASSLAVHLCPH